MKRKTRVLAFLLAFVLALLPLSQTATAEGQSIQDMFPDPVMAQAVAEQLDRQVTDTATAQELALVMYIDAQDVDNWSGIERLTGLLTISLGFSPDASGASSLSDLSALTELYYIDITGQALSGSLADLQRLTKLQTLSLWSDNVTGSLSDLRPLTKLRSLALWSDNVTGTLADLRNRPELIFISVYCGDLSGSLSELGAMTDIGFLSIGGDGVTGSLSDLENLTKLTHLTLSCPNVTGSLAALRSMTEIFDLAFHDANVTGSLSALRHMTKLKYLMLDGTSIEGSLADLQGFSELKELTLFETLITGALSDLETLTNIYMLWLSGDGIRGDLSGLRNMGKVWWIWIDCPNVTGTLAGLSALNNLSTLEIFHSSVSGPLSALGQKEKLVNLDLSGTSVSGKPEDRALFPSLANYSPVNLFSGVTPEVSVSTPKIVSSLAANLNITVSGVDGANLWAFLEVDGQLLYGTLLVGGSGRMTISAAPPAGWYSLVVRDKGFSKEFMIEVVPYNTDIWAAACAVQEGKVVLIFNEALTLKNAASCVKIGAATYGAAVLADGKTVEILNLSPNAVTAGTKIVISGVKYPELFPSYSFTFTINA